MTNTTLTLTEVYDLAKTALMKAGASEAAASAVAREAAPSPHGGARLGAAQLRARRGESAPQAAGAGGGSRRRRTS